MQEKCYIIIFDQHCMEPHDCKPLILTLKFDNAAQLLFNDLRKLYFPAERNFLDAHLTLFHQLPANEQSILSDIENIARNTSRLVLQIESIVSIGNGTAYKIASGVLVALHQSLQQKWMQWIIPQDKQKLWPHITVQNKVSTEKAKELQAILKSDFKPFEIYGIGFSLWEYRGGPWEFVKSYEFTGNS